MPRLLSSHAVSEPDEFSSPLDKVADTTLLGKGSTRHDVITALNHESYVCIPLADMVKCLTFFIVQLRAVSFHVVFRSLTPYPGLISLACVLSYKISLSFAF